MHASKPEGTRGDGARTDRIEPRDAAIWILVCASLPVLFAVVEMAFHATVHSERPGAQRIVDSLIAAVLLIPLLCGYLQWYALRRFAHALRLWWWLPAGAFSLAIALGAAHWISLNERRFEIALASWRMHDSIDMATAMQVCLSFAALVAGSGTVAVLKSLPQSALLGSASGLSWRLFLGAAVAGAVAATMAEQLANLAGLYRPSTLHGLGWGQRLVEFSLRASFGAIYGIVSGYALTRMLPRDVGAPTMKRVTASRLGVVFLVASLASLCVPVLVAVIGRDGGRSTLMALRKTFTSAPAADASQGEAILRYSHAAAALPGRYPVVRFSPDSGTFLVLDKERRVMLVDTATGRTLGQLAETLTLHERYDVAWNFDGSVLALRTQGAAERIPGTPYSRFRPRIRTYAMPERKLLREFQPSGDTCHVSAATVSLIFAPDARSVWTLCDQYAQPRAEDIMAVQLDAASLQPLTLRRYGAQFVAAKPRTLGIAGGRVMYLQHRSSQQIEEIRLGPLDDDGPVLRIDNLGVPGLADGLTLQEDVIEQDHLVADYCGVPASAASNQAPSICRAIRLDATTGAVQHVTDDVDRRFAGPHWTLSSRTGLRVEASWQVDGKQGKITVLNGRAGAIRQHIDTYEQRPLAFSPDMHWLVTHAPGRRTLNVYRVAP
jgi:hypothetical protein